MTSTYQIRAREVGCRFGHVGIVADARGEIVAESATVRPFGATDVALADARALAAERRLQVQGPPDPELRELHGLAAQLRGLRATAPRGEARGLTLVVDSDGMIAVLGPHRAEQLPAVLAECPEVVAHAQRQRAAVVRYEALAARLGVRP